MKKDISIKLFDENRIRSVWSDQEEKWYFSVVDIVGILSGSTNGRNYWKVLKNRLKKEGSEVVTKCNQLKLPSADGKNYLTDVADTESILRIVQTIPSPQAEPFKLWLAKVGYERIEEIANPEQSFDRARENWQKAGRSEKWIQQRMTGQETRNKLTDYWKSSGVEQSDAFAYLTNVIHQEWTGLTVKGHKAVKGLKSQNLRDHMTEAELIFTALAEMSTRQIAETDEAKGVTENAKAGRRVERSRKTHD